MAFSVRTLCLLMLQIELPNKPMMTDDNSWKSLNFRLGVASKIDATIQQCGITPSRTSRDMENCVFQKVKSKEQYLKYIAKLILHLREPRPNKVSGDSWRSPTFRQSVVSKIDKEIRQSGIKTSHTSLQMEKHIFQKAKSQEEYLGYAARLILHVRERKEKKVSGMGVPGANQAGPIDAIQNLATEGSRNTLMPMGAPQQGPMPQS